MNKYLLDPNVCPSSLNEKDEPTNPNETAHKWDTTTNTCAECGTTRQPVTQERREEIAREIERNLNRAAGVVRNRIIEGLSFDAAASHKSVEYWIEQIEKLSEELSA